MKTSYQDNLTVIENELRAVLGHLSEYTEIEEDEKKNLEKAKSHFRRASIDILKILCNGLDQVFDEWIQKYIKYDFRNTDNSFMPEYVDLYYQAHNAYLQVQQKEKLGSDKGNSITKQYLNVANMYVDLYEYHNREPRKKIEKSVKN